METEVGFSLGEEGKGFSGWSTGSGKGMKEGNKNEMSEGGMKNEERGNASSGFVIGSNIMYPFKRSHCVSPKAASSS